MNEFLPLLKDSRWVVEIANEKGLVYSEIAATLLPNGVVVSYVIENNDQLLFLDKYNYSASEVEAAKLESLSNLRTRLANVEWDVIDGGPLQGGIKLLSCRGDFFASECVLLKDRMEEAHMLLTSDKLLVCAPVRGLLIACSFKEEIGVEQKTFVDVCLENNRGEDNEPLSPLIWICEGGELISVLDVSVFSNVELTHENKTDENIKSGPRIYRVSQIVFMALFGSLFAGLYGIASNYKTLGLKKRLYQTIFAGLFLVPSSAFIFVNLPESSYDRLFPLFIAVFIWLIAKFLQANHIESAFKRGAKKQSLLNQIVVILSSLMVTLLLFVAVIEFQ